MMPTLLGGVVLSYIAIDNMLEGPLRIFLKDYIDLKEFGSNIREEGLFYLVLGLGIFQIIIALQSFIQPVIEINNGRIAIRTKMLVLLRPPRCSVWSRSRTRSRTKSRLDWSLNKIRIQ